MAVNVKIEKVTHNQSVANVESEFAKDLLNKDDKMSHNKKEKSRDAARSRRGRENCEFYSLATLLPIPEDSSCQLDKASIIRLTMSFLQLRQFVYKTLTSPPKFLLDSKQLPSACLSMALQSLDGFLIIINSKGRCLYVSNSISEDLGLAQVDLIGSSLFHFVLPSDHEELQHHLKSSCCNKSNQKFCQQYSLKDSKDCKCSFFIRMKSTQTRRALGIKSSGYKVAHVTGHLIHRGEVSAPSSGSESNDDDDEKPNTCSIFVGLVRALTHAPVEMSVDEHVFVLRTDRSLRISYCEEKVQPLTQYDLVEVKGRTIYQFIHDRDLEGMRTCHKELLEKGHVVTPLYRWLLKNGSHLFVQSRGSILHDKYHSNDAADHNYSWITYVVTRACDVIPGAAQKRKTADDGTSAQEHVKRASSQATESPDHLASQVSCPEDDSIVKAAETPSQSQSSVSRDLQRASAKLVKQLPGKSLTLKRSRSESSGHSDGVIDAFKEDVLCAKTKRERTNTGENPASILSNLGNVGVTSSQRTARNEDVLDVHSTQWGNPPNREAANHSDLYTTVIHHHYPYGIDPNLLNSNPIFAKMLTTNYVTYESLAQKDAFLLRPPAVNIFAPVLGSIPQLITTQQAKLSYCSPSVASVVDELRQDPLRKVNPPNKVVLSRSQIPKYNDLKNASCPDPLLPPTPMATSVNPHLLAFSGLPGNNLMLPSLTGLEGQSSSGAIFLHPIKLAHEMNSLNSLHI